MFNDDHGHLLQEDLGRLHLFPKHGLPEKHAGQKNMCEEVQNNQNTEIMVCLSDSKEGN